MRVNSKQEVCKKGLKEYSINLNNLLQLYHFRYTRSSNVYFLTISPKTTLKSEVWSSIRNNSRVLSWLSAKIEVLRGGFWPSQPLDRTIHVLTFRPPPEQDNGTLFACTINFHGREEGAEGVTATDYIIFFDIKAGPIPPRRREGTGRWVETYVERYRVQLWCGSVDRIDRLTWREEGGGGSSLSESIRIRYRQPSGHPPLHCCDRFGRDSALRRSFSAERQ